MPVNDRKPVNVDDDKHNIELMYRQCKNDTNNDASQVFVSIPIGSTVMVQRGRWRTVDPWDDCWKG